LFDTEIGRLSSSSLLRNNFRLTRREASGPRLPRDSALKEGGQILQTLKKFSI
jgi:hypothetical protein